MISLTRQSKIIDYRFSRPKVNAKHDYANRIGWLIVSIFCCCILICENAISCVPNTLERRSSAESAGPDGARRRRRRRRRRNARRSHAARILSSKLKFQTSDEVLPVSACSQRIMSPLFLCCPLLALSPMPFDTRTINAKAGGIGLI